MKIKNVEKKEVGTGEITKQYAEDIFKELLAFQGYGFCKCIGLDSRVSLKRARVMRTAYIAEVREGDEIWTPDGWQKVLHVWRRRKEAYVSNFGGFEITSSMEHRFECEDGRMHSLEDISKNDLLVMTTDGIKKFGGFAYCGEIELIDIEIDHPNHRFFANGIVTSNSHATSYSVYSAVQMWLQEHYFLEYMCALLSHIDRAKEKKDVGVLNERIEYCMKHGTMIYYPDVNHSSDKWEICAGGLLAPLKNIKGFSDREVKIIEENRPYKDLADFLDKTKFNNKRFERLLFANALGTWGCVEDLYNWYYNHYFEKDKKKSKPKKIETFDLFSMGGESEDELSSSVQPAVIKTFTKNELEDLCLDLNGFVINENVQIKYNEYFERGMAKVAELKHNEDYNKPHRRIYKLDAALNDGPEEDKYKNKWVLAKVTSEARGIPSKWGRPFDKIVVNDGFTNVTLMGTIPKEFKKGNVLVFPISINDNGKVYIDRNKTNKLEIVIVEAAQ